MTEGDALWDAAFSLAEVGLPRGVSDKDVQREMRALMDAGTVRRTDFRQFHTGAGRRFTELHDEIVRAMNSIPPEVRGTATIEIHGNTSGGGSIAARVDFDRPMAEYMADVRREAVMRLANRQFNKDLAGVLT